jgi:hypothetical protein
VPRQGRPPGGRSRQGLPDRRGARRPTRSYVLNALVGVRQFLDELRVRH